jgi:hypothetical protein
MKDPETSKALVPVKRAGDRISEALLAVVSEVPPSSEPPSRTPSERARAIILAASTRSAMISGTLALPPGPAGMVTVLPDLVAIWNVQRQMVADIAAAFGKSAQLGRSEMIYCLFRHAAGQAVRDLVVRVGERYLVRQATLRLVQTAMRRIGVSVSERAAGKAVSRWLPIVGAIGIGGYAFYDTSRVGKTAIAFFEKEIVREDETGA